MALVPKRVKFRKVQKGRRLGMSSTGCNISFGEYGLQALSNVWITDRQIEAARVAIMRHLQGGGKLWIRVFPDKPITKKPSETRMGKGKGAPSGWVCVVKKGRIMLELEGVPIDLAREAFRLASHKMPVNSQFVVRGA